MQNTKTYSVDQLFTELCKLEPFEIEEFIVRAIESYPADPSLSIECIYFLLDYLLYGRYADVLEGNQIENMLRNVFEKNSARFGRDAKYLCYVGFFIAIAFWHFGQTDLTLSHKMMQSAFELEPTNALYEWAWRFSTSDRTADIIAVQLLNDVDFVRRMSDSTESERYLLESIRNSVRLRRELGIN